MPRIYATLCEVGKRNFNYIDEKLKEETRVIIESEGYQINEDGTVQKIII